MVSLALRGKMNMGISMLIYEPPDVQQTDTLDAFFDRFRSRKLILPADIDWRARKLKDFIDAHAGETHWNMENVCKELGLSMSSRQARRLFRSSTGIGIREYRMNVRFAVAEEHLRATNMPIKVVAAEAGYQNSRHFARRFKDVFHLKPMEFRRVWQRTELVS
jgi:transcriptional regulator GlxA family with amidase domain